MENRETAGKNCVLGMKIFFFLHPSSFIQGMKFTQAAKVALKPCLAWFHQQLLQQLLRAKGVGEKWLQSKSTMKSALWREISNVE
jgi:hypothetical protein